MGIVSKEASYSALLSYIGVGIGFVNVTLIMTRLFSLEEFGLREILLNVAVFSSQIAHLGTYRSMVKFFPVFNKEGKKDNGLLSIGLLVSLIGFSLVSILILIFKEQITLFYIEKSPLFIDYFWFVFPLIFLLLYNNVLDSYLQSRSKTAYSVFLKSIFNRLVFSFLLLAYYLNWIDFYWFIVCFILSYALNIILFLLHLYRRGELVLKLHKGFFRSSLRKVYFNYSAFSILSGTSSVLVNKLDALMIAGFIGLASTGIYANAVYLTVLIAIPSDAISRITMPLLSKSWKDRRLDQMKELYQKTAISQLLLSGIIFLLMWSSIDNFFSLQKDAYANGKWVFFILGAAKLINTAFGVNGQIISLSKYYRFDTTTSLLLGVLTIVTNYLFIPIWGIEGAALATGLSILIFNLIRFAFLYNKLKIQPFTLSSFLALVILALGFTLGTYLPHHSNIFLDTAIRSIVLGLVVIIPSYYLNLSVDLNNGLEGLLKRIGLRNN